MYSSCTALIDEKLYSEEVAVLVNKCISERRNSKCVIRRNMKVHLRNIKMEIYERKKYEVGNICNKEEYAPSTHFNLLSDPCRGSDLETAFWVLVLAYNLRRGCCST